MGKNRKLTIYPVTTDSSAQIRLSGYRVYQEPRRIFGSPCRFCIFSFDYKLSSN